MTKFCTHMAVFHEKPEDFSEAHANLAYLISVIQGLFWVIHGTLSGQDNKVAEVAGLGGDLCEELERRTALLRELRKADHTAAAAPGKED